MNSDESEMFAQMAFALHHEKVPEATVHLVVDYARTAVRCDEAGVAVTRRNRVETAAATSMIVRRADQFQQSLREGPALEVRFEPTHIVVDDTLADDRWPRWAERVALLGLRSVLSVPLHTAERTYGALNLYSKDPGTFSAGDVAVAATFARHASIAMASGEEVFHLKLAADNRNLLGQAQGILMERFDITSDRAFDVLRRHSQSHNVKLAVIAQQVVDQRQLPASAPLPPAPSDAPAEPERPPMTLTSVDDGPHRIIGVVGEIDVSTATDFIEAALSAVESGRRHLIVDMHQTTFIDSSGLSAFILVQKALAKQGGTLDLVGLVDRVQRLFRMAGLEHVIHLHASLDEAKESLGSR